MALAQGLRAHSLRGTWGYYSGGEREVHGASDSAGTDDGTEKRRKGAVEFFAWSSMRREVSSQELNTGALLTLVLYGIVRLASWGSAEIASFETRPLGLQ